MQETQQRTGTSAAGDDGRVVLLAGTTDGAYFFFAGPDRRTWRRSGPHLPGCEVYSLLGVQRPGGGLRVFAGTSYPDHGPTIRISDTLDAGDTPQHDDFQEAGHAYHTLGSAWTAAPDSPRFAPEDGATVKHFWQLAATPLPDTLLAGVEDAGLFVSRDGGLTWRPVEGLNRHPSRPTWQCSRGGLALHSIVVDLHRPQRLWVAISGAGVLRTADGGQSWQLCGAGLPQPNDPARQSEADARVTATLNHKLVADPRDASTLYLQHFEGPYRSADGGDTWHPIGAQGLPSRFGFPLAVSAAGDLFAAPLEGPHARYVPQGRLRLYRSSDGGYSWQPLAAGLPSEPQRVAVLRDALATDALHPAGVYVGTTAGDLFASSDAGQTWQPLPGRYARITCLATVLLPATR